MDEIIIVDHNPEWAQLFAREEALLRSVLSPDLVTRIEHFGSTSIPGLAAKPVIDILVGVRSLEEAKQDAVPVLEGLGYSYWRDDPRTDHLFLVKGLPPHSSRSHHLHIIESGSVEWEHLLFRDYLRAHRHEAKRYANLKRDLAAVHREDREAYTDAKAEYIRRVTEIARQESDNSAVGITDLDKRP